MMGINLPIGTCPVCGHEHSAATDLFSSAPGTPSPGDFSVCIYCGLILVFQENLQLKKARPRDLHGIDSEVLDNLIRLQRMVKKVKKERRI